MKLRTKTIHAGQHADKETGAVIVPLYLASTFKMDAINKDRGFEYSRSGNPTRQALEKCLAELENGKFGLAFSSGLAAEHAVISTLKPGDHVIAPKDMYGGTFRLFDKIFRELGLLFSYTGSNPEDFEKAIRPETKLIWLESPTNPAVRLIDIASVCRVAHTKNIKVAVDNTFASPYFQQPLILGADLVLHSTTKYIGGHSDLIGGILALNDEEWYNRIKFIQNAVGAVPGAFDCWLMLRGLKTLHVRMERHEENALRVASFLESHPRIGKVFYPGLISNPYHELAKKQMTGFGGVVSFTIKDGNKKMVDKFFSGLKIITLAESLGGVESLISYPATMSHGSVTPEARLEVGITDDMIRFSVGIEDIDDLIGDLTEALAF
jgi:cystathionine gamma-lyase